MKKALFAGVVLLNSLILLFALFRLQPFARANDLLDRAFGAPPKWTQVVNLYKDPRTQEVSHGEHPGASFDQLADYWREQPGPHKVVLIGNSQMHTESLAPGEPPPNGQEKTYPDLIPQHPAEGPEYLFYRLSAGGTSYSEVLWYVKYLISRPDVRPQIILLQINYQAFWQAGIRDGMLELLQLPSFRKTVEAAANSNQPFSDSFREALQHYAELQARVTRSPDAARRPGFGEAVETATRDLLAKAPEFEQRHSIKDSFFETLYRIRLYFLRIKPSTPRSITGARLVRSQAAVEEIARVCRDNGVHLIFFHAPLNPEVKLYLNAADRTAHYAFVNQIGARYGVPIVDLENAIPANLWGRLLNGPDPLHLGRAAHRQMAQLMSDILARNGAK